MYVRRKRSTAGREASLFSSVTLVCPGYKAHGSEASLYLTVASRRVVGAICPGFCCLRLHTSHEPNARCIDPHNDTSSCDCLLLIALDTRFLNDDYEAAPSA